MSGGLEGDHRIRAVFDPADEIGYVYSLGASQEFVVNPIPRNLVLTFTTVMNWLINSRVAQGHPVLEGHVIQSQGFCFMAKVLKPNSMIAKRCRGANTQRPIIRLLQLDNCGHCAGPARVHCDICQAVYYCSTECKAADLDLHQQHHDRK